MDNDEPGGEDDCGVLDTQQPASETGRQRRKERNKASNARSIFVLNIRKGTVEGLTEVFERYGSIDRIILDAVKKYAIVEFKEPVGAHVALSVPVNERPYYNKRRLIIKPRIQSLPTEPLKIDDTGAKIKERNQRVKDTLTTQIWDLEKSSHLTEDQLEVRNKVYNRLADAIKEEVNTRYGNCALVLFGSSATGLAGISSDIDLCLLTETNPTREEIGDLLKKIGNRLDRLGHVNIFYLLKTKCPVLKYTDLITYTSVDLSVNNMIAIRNTALLQTYQSCCPVLHTVMVVLKAWKTAANLAFPTSYSLFLMTVSYIQRQGWLPVLQKKADITKEMIGGLSNIKTEKSSYITQLQEGQHLNLDWLMKPGICTIGQWNCFFTDPALLNINLKVPDPSEVIRGFFQYYTSYDYDKQYISISGNPAGDDYYMPYTAPPPLGKQSVYDMPNKMKMRSKLCIQDPFELTHNTAVGMEPGFMASFEEQLDIGCRILEKNGDLKELLAIQQNINKKATKHTL